MNSSLKHRLKLSLKISLALITLLLIATTGAAFYIHSDSGREYARQKIETALSEKLQGKFTIKHLDEVSWDRVVARDFIITAPNGDKVIDLRKILLKPVWSAILTGSIEASAAEVTGGVVRIIEGEDTLSIVKALKSPPRKEGEKKGKPIQLLFDHIETKDLEVIVDSKSMPILHFKDIVGLVRFEAHGKVVVTLNKVNSHVDFPILGDTKLRQVSGTIRSKVMEVINFKLNMELGDLVPTRFTYTVPKNEKKPGDPKMTIRFSKEKSPSFFPKLVLNMADKLTSFIDVDFE